MPTLRLNEAIERLARAAEAASPDNLIEIYAELFPRRGRPTVTGTLGRELAEQIRSGLEPEEVVDLWGVVFPADRHVYYDEEANLVRYNEEEPWYAER
jgi:hypothetical protein